MAGMIKTRVTSTSDKNNNNNVNTARDDGGVIHTEGHGAGDFLDAAPPFPSHCFTQRRSRRRKGKGSSREPLSPLLLKSNLTKSLPVQTAAAPKSPEMKANYSSGGKRPRRLIKSTSSACDTPPQPARSRTKKRVSQFLRLRSPRRGSLSAESSFTTPCFPVDSKLRGRNKENSELSDCKQFKVVRFYFL